MPAFMEILYKKINKNCAKNQFKSNNYYLIKGSCLNLISKCLYTNTNGNIAASTITYNF